MATTCLANTKCSGGTVAWYVLPPDKGIADAGDPLDVAPLAAFVPFLVDPRVLWLSIVCLFVCLIVCGH